MKAHFRRLILQKAIASIDVGQGIPTIDVLEAIPTIARSWKQVKTSVIANCFSKAGVFLATDVGEEEKVEENLIQMWHAYTSKVSNINDEADLLKNHIDVDASLFTEQATTVNSLLVGKKMDQDRGTSEADSDLSEEDDDTASAMAVSSRLDAMNAMLLVRKCVQSRPHALGALDACSVGDAFLLQDAETTIQGKITSFFTSVFTANRQLSLDTALQPVSLSPS